MTYQAPPLRDFLEGKKFLKISRDTLIRDIAVEMPNHHSSAAVVLDESGMLVGTITEKDIVEKAVGARRNVDKTQAQDIMTTNPVTIPVETPLRGALLVMIDRGVRSLPVMEEGKVVGIIDIRDLYEKINAILQDRLNADESLISYCYGESYATGLFGNLRKAE